MSKKLEYAMPDQAVTVDDKLFVGRVEEQKQFRAALAEVLDPPPGEDLPYVCLLYGDGGTGKTTLAKRFHDITGKEPPFAGKFNILWIDWEDERKKYPGMQVGRNLISPETVFKVLHAAAIRQKWGRQFAAYRKAVKKREETAKEVAQAITADNDWDELAVLRSLSVDALAKIVRTRIPLIGEAGEEIVEAFLEAGIKIGADQAAKLATAIETQLRAHLKSDNFDYFLNPFEQMAFALARGLNRVANNKPLLIVLDTYEIVDRVDIWIRAVTRAAGPNVMWIVSGRNDLVESRRFGSEYFKGYADESPRRLLAYRMRPLAIENIRTYLQDSATERELSDQEIEAISRVTRGIPLAVKEAVDIWKAGAKLDEIVVDGRDVQASSQIVQKMTDRYMQHVVAESDRQALYSLALADGDVDLLRGMLQPLEGGAFDLEDLLRRLERDYASVHADRARLHDDPAVFFKDYLKADVRRTSERVRGLSNRAVDVIRERMAGLETELPRIEDRCQDENWIKATLSMAHYLFWVDETSAWHWIIPRYVEGMAYSRDLRDGLVEVVASWKWISENTERFFQVLAPAGDDDLTRFPVLMRLAERGWLDGNDKMERQAILNVHQGNHLLRLGQFDTALQWYENAETGLPIEGRLLKSQLADAYELLAHRLLWPSDRYQPATDATAERILIKVLDWFPERPYAWYLLGVHLSAARQDEQAIDALQRAINLNPQYVAAYSALGNVYTALNQADDARAAYDKALAVDPNSAKSHGGLGTLHQTLGNPQEAIESYERAIEQDNRYVDARIGLGQMYLAAGRDTEALETLRHAEAMGIKKASVQTALGDAYLIAGQVDESLASYQAAIEVEPSNAAPHIGLGHVYRVLGQQDEAIASFEQAIEFAPGLGAPHAGLGDVHTSAGRKAQAIVAYEQAIGLGHANANTYDHLAQAYRNSGRYSDALNAHQEAIKLDPDYRHAYDNLGEVYLALDRYQDAYDAFQRFSASREADATSLTGVADALCGLRRFDEAQAAYEQAMELDSEYAPAYRGLGDVYRGKRLIDQALPAYWRAAELDPANPSVQIGLGDAYVLKNQYKKAISAYQQALELSPQDPRPYKGLGDVYLELNMPNAARDAYENALDRDSGLAAAYNGLGNALVQLRHHRKAIKAFRQSIRYDPGYPLPHVNLGRLYLRHGHYEEAESSFLGAIHLDPANSYAFEGLGDFKRTQSAFVEAIEALRRLWNWIVSGRLFLISWGRYMPIWVGLARLSTLINGR